MDNIKIVPKERGHEAVDRIQVAGFCEHGDEHASSIKG
jgi:hypothetical protein